MIVLGLLLGKTLYQKLWNPQNSREEWDLRLTKVIFSHHQTDILQIPSLKNLSFKYVTKRVRLVWGASFLRIFIALSSLCSPLRLNKVSVRYIGLGLGIRHSQANRSLKFFYIWKKTQFQLVKPGTQLSIWRATAFQ